MKKRKKAKKKQVYKGVGKLENCPYQITEYQCCKCLKWFSFVAGLRCDCEKHHKYRAKPIMVGGLRFDGFKEGQRFSKLFFLQSKGLIGDLVTHPTFPMIVEGKKICVYEADFRYSWEKGDVIEDVKGKLTDVFKLKKKLFEALYKDLTLELVLI